MLEELGANLLNGGGCGFLAWAPLADKMEVAILHPEKKDFGMKKHGDGYFEAEVGGVGAGARYLYRIDGRLERPDPASRYQPGGVHAPSEVLDHGSFLWGDGAWRGLPLKDYIIYELHVGAFTPEGTFDAASARVPYLRDLGVTAVELMPVSQFPGERNWGYDGAYPFAVQESYGGPDGLKRLVDALHGNGMAAILDVVYNHLGPEGNYLGDFGPYFTDRYVTPWGRAVNFDGPWSDGVRRFFVENAIYWLENFHMDALRIDAVHGIFDLSPRHILREIKEAVVEKIKGRRVYLIPESDLNDARLIKPAEAGGYGLDAQWNDDFHHALHTLLTGESTGYYADFGDLGHMAKAVGEGFVYSGQYSGFRKRRHGSPTLDRPPGQFVLFSQNHDQVGNRAEGDRLASTLGPEKLRLAASMVAFTPGIPLFFMGEEYGETAPFQYFVSHSDRALVDAVRKGRLAEFEAFGWKEVPDPQDEATFLRSKIDIGKAKSGPHKELLDFYRTVIGLRKEISPLLEVEREEMEVEVHEKERSIVLRLPGLIYAANFGDRPCRLEIIPPGGGWVRLLDTSQPGSGGPQSGIIQRFIRLGPYGFSLYKKIA